MEKRDRQIVVNMPPAKKQEIAYAAEAAKRSMSNYLLWCYEEVKGSKSSPSTSSTKTVGEME